MMQLKNINLIFIILGVITGINCEKVSANSSLGNVIIDNKIEDTIYEPVNAIVKTKKQDNVQYSLITWNNIAIKTGCNETGCLMQIIMDNKVLNDWQSQVLDIDNSLDIEIYVNKRNKDFYIVYKIPVEEYEVYKVFYVNSYKVIDKGNFLPDNNTAEIYFLSSAYSVEEQKKYIYSKDQQLFMDVVDDNNNVLLHFNNIYKATKDKLSGEVLKQAVQKFNWESLISKGTSLVKIVDLDKNGTSEKFQVDFILKKIFALNEEAKQVLNNQLQTKYLFFKADTLMVKQYSYDNSGYSEAEETTYYFLYSKPHKEFILNKILHERYIDDLAGFRVCSVKEVYQEKQVESISFVDFQPSGYDLTIFSRSFNLTELNNQIRDNLNNDEYFSYCSLPPNPKELFFLIRREPVTIININGYIDLASNLIKIKSESNSKAVLSSVVYLLEKILLSFPDNKIAQLTLGDAYWESGFIDKASAAYKKYLELIRLQTTNSNNLPPRVKERIID